MSPKSIVAAVSLLAVAAFSVASAQPAQWWVQGNAVSGNPVGCQFYNNTGVPLRITTYRFFTGAPQPYTFTCTTNCVVHPGQTRVMVSPMTNANSFNFTCDALVSNY